MSDDVKYITLSNSLRTLVDADDYEFLKHRSWTAVKKKRSSYACSIRQTPDGPKQLYMHRVVANTPANMVTHHKNRNSLDNRKANLQNMLRSDHKILHINNPLKVRTQGAFTGLSEV